MKAARLHRVGEELKIDSIQEPEVGTDDVLVDIKASGICHSDINYRNGVCPVGKLPIILGHEIAGTVAKVGSLVENVKEEDRVCVNYVVSCGNCAFCSIGKENLCDKYRMIGKDVDGGFAEYIRVPSRNILKLPSLIPFEQGAILGCALSTAIHALRRGRVSVGDSVVIYGVGGVGVHAVQLAARIFGAEKVIAVDISPEKLKLAKKVGADEIINAMEADPVERLREITYGKLADVALDFVGFKNTIEKTVDCVGKGGRIVLVGISQDEIKFSPYENLISREREFIGADDHLKIEMDQLIKLVSSGKIDLSHSITHKLSLDEINYGFEVLEKKIGNPVRVVLTQ